ncbi:MAG: hypothetical protein EPN82_03155 [Bacteroidetes bacterium]|nr:MAG: hypothetical protein EPN82_03155 [Bacteroidota bacterium]
MKKYYILIAALFILAVSCVKQPSEPIDDNTNIGETGAFILCEGLFKMDNSTLDRLDFSSNSIINDYYGKSNSGLRLGDLSSDIVIIGNRTYITVSSSHTIEVMETSTGKSLGRIIYSQSSNPRKICMINDSIGYVTDLMRNSISKVNFKSLTIIIDSLPVGPAPEGIAFYNNNLFVANSGFGDYMANVPKAGSVSVIDITTNQELKELKNLPNVIDVLVNKKSGKLYVGYLNLPSLTDSTGGIAEFDLNTLDETRRWKFRASAITLSSTGDSLFFFKDSTVSMLKLNDANPQSQELFKNPASSETWYSLSYSAYNNSLYIGNAKNFQVNGSLLIYPLNDLLNPKVFQTGINPNKIVFF